MRVVALGEVCVVVSGATPKTGDPSLWGGHIPWATPKDLSDVGDMYIRSTPRTITDRGLRSCSSTVLPPRSVLLSSRAPIGYVAINTVPMATNQGFKSLIPDPERVYPEYLAWWLKSNTKLLQFMGNGATFKELPKSSVERIEIPLPPVEEQRRIAAILDKADELRAKRRAALAHVDSLTQSIFLDMFGDPATNRRGWPTATLGDLLDAIDSGVSPVCEARRANPYEWGVLKLGAVTWCEYDELENKALPANVKPIDRNEVRAGDVLFARKNTLELVGACAYVEQTRPRLLLSDLIFRLRLRPNQKVLARYLHQLLITPAKRQQVRRFAGGSAGSMPNISKANLAKVEIEIPPIELQQEFERSLIAVRASRVAAREESSVFDELFASLQHRAFSGAL